MAIIWLSAVVTLFGAAAHAETLIRGPGFEVSAEQVESELALMPPQLAGQIRDDPRRLKTLVNDLYDRKALAAEAKRSGLEREREVAYSLDRAAERELAKAVSDREQKRITSNAPDFTDLAKERYHSRRGEYAVPERRRIRHILLRAGTPEERAARRPEAEAILQRLRQGEAFPALAKENSEDDESATDGGDLGYLPRGRLVSPLDDAAFSLSGPGEISGIVETRYGLHLITVVDIKPGRTFSFEEVKDSIITRLKTEYVKNEMAAWRSSVVDPTSAVVDEDAVKAFIDRVAKPEQKTESPTEAENRQNRTPLSSGGWGFE
jgi:peptidyl-prolyl cis-trans isomerase C